MTITARPAPNAAPARLKVRKNIESLSAQEFTDFRRAVKQAIALNDKRGFDYFAGWHGVPLGWCHYHDPAFLSWHRAYLYWLELALQSQTILLVVLAATEPAERREVSARPRADPRVPTGAMPSGAGATV